MPAIVNPSAISMEPSPDHSAIGFDGVTPKVTGYKFRFFLATDDPVTATPVSVVDIGKPAIPPLGGGKFTVGRSVWGKPPLQLNTEYIAAGVAYGPGGDGPQTATVTDPFAFSDVPAAPGAILLVP